MSARRTANLKLREDYVADWQTLIDAATDPHVLLDRWQSERDLRDDLKIPIAARLSLLKQIAPEEVSTAVLA